MIKSISGGLKHFLGFLYEQLGPNWDTFYYSHIDLQKNSIFSWKIHAKNDQCTLVYHRVYYIRNIAQYVKKEPWKIQGRQTPALGDISHFVRVGKKSNFSSFPLITPEPLGLESAK